MESRTVSNFDVTPEENIRQLIRVTLNQQGGNPSFLLELLADVIEMDIWKSSGLTFSQFVNTPYDKGGLGWSVKDLKAVLSLTHRYEAPNPVNRAIADRLAAMRAEVNRLLGEDIKPTDTEGGDRKSEEYKSLVHVQVKTGNSRERIIARLKGNGQSDLAQRVINEEISAAEAKRQAGWKSKRPAIAADNPQSAANTILANMTREDIVSLLAILADAIAERK